MGNKKNVKGVVEKQELSSGEEDYDQEFLYDDHENYDSKLERV